MRREFPLAQAAARADMDERSFRLLGDRRIIYPTPRTRTQGRGKQKLYSTDEILIASILSPLLKLGADSFSLGELADWLRKHIGSREFGLARAGTPVYVRLDYPEAGQWGVSLDPAESRRADADKTDASHFSLPVTDVGGGDNPKAWSKAFIAVKLDDRIRRVEWDLTSFMRDSNTPSQALKYLSEAGAKEAWTTETTEGEFDALLETAKQGAANGDKWPDA